MNISGENVLTDMLLKNASAKLIESHIYSILSDVEITNSYDSQFGNIYDRVACSPLYNRLIWGYSISEFATFADVALRSSDKGNVLDLGCGSLAFTALSYLKYSDRPVVLVDQSLKMLRIAKARLIMLSGKVPENMVFLHADALHLPFQADCFNTVISLNLLHCLDNTRQLLMQLKRILCEGGNMYFTTLVKANRFADFYLKALADGGKLISRNVADHRRLFTELGMPVQYTLKGNMAFIYEEAIKSARNSK